MRNILITGTCVVILLCAVVQGAPIPSAVKGSVVFVYIDEGFGPIPNGTAFLVGVPVPNQADRFYLYLVTAGHVLRCDQTGPPYSRIFIRFNLRHGGVDFAEVPLVTAGTGQNVFFHPDPTVDIAIMPVVLNQEVVDFTFLPDDMIADTEVLKTKGVQEGTDVFFTGLFLQSISASRNVPIVRFGRLAFSAAEPVVWNGVLRDLYLIESASYGGNSGAPVFFYLGSDRNLGSLTLGWQLFLAGVMMGAYQDNRPILFVQTSQLPISQSNLGIAAVVPAEKIRELIDWHMIASRRRPAPN